jgi:hypothetical protein
VDNSEINLEAAKKLGCKLFCMIREYEKASNKKKSINEMISFAVSGRGKRRGKDKGRDKIPMKVYIVLAPSNWAMMDLRVKTGSQHMEMAMDRVKWRWHDF